MKSDAGPRKPRGCTPWRVTWHRLPLAMVALTLAGCARPVAPPPASDTRPPAGPPAPTATRPGTFTTSPAPGKKQPPAKPPSAAAQARPATPAPQPPGKQWVTPPGKLDDAKFITISAKYLAGVHALRSEGKLTDKSPPGAQELVLKQILKDANVTVQEYQAYAKQVADDPARTERIRDAVVAEVMKHTGIKLMEPRASIEKLKPLGKFKSGKPAAKGGQKKATGSSGQGR